MHIKSLRGLVLMAVSALPFASADLTSDLSDRGFQLISQGSDGASAAFASFNSRFSYSPAAVTYPSTAEDISTILKVAQEYNLTVATRSGGHSYVANGVGGKSGAVVIDLKNFKSIAVDSSTNVATIGTGSLLGPIAVALDAKGRAMPHGTCAYVGIGGHAGHGGYGYTSRKWGLAVDAVQSLDVVLANGTIVNNVSEATYPDLFWALRGASGALGVVTSYRFKTFAAPPSVIKYLYIWDSISAENMASALATLQDHFLTANVSSDLGLSVALYPTRSKGYLRASLSGAFYGSVSDFNSTIAPLVVKLPQFSRSDATQKTYIQSVQVLAGNEDINVVSPPSPPAQRHQFYAKSLMIPEASPISETALAAFTKFVTNEGIDYNASDWWIIFSLFGGAQSAINKVPTSATAFSRRSSLFTMQFYAKAYDDSPFPDSAFTLLDGMVASLVDNSPKKWDYGAYTNYMDNQLENWKSLYFSTNYDRLEALKRQYDPKNTFNFPS